MHAFYVSSVATLSDSSDAERSQSNGRRCGVSAGRLAGALAGLALVGAVAVVGARSQHRRVSGDARGGVQLFLAEAAELAAAAFEGYKASTEALAKGDEFLEKAGEAGEVKEEEVEKLREEAEHPQAELGPNLIRAENMHDGNVCAEDEETFGGLCYKKCAELEEGYPIRTSAFSCCKERPCGLFNSKESSLLKWCGGFSISGDHAGHSKGGCPHPPGVCYKDEELHLGVCYAKCTLLTGAAYPFRSGAASCCKIDSPVACGDAMYSQTKPEYAIGGGKGDGTKRTFAYPHPPIPVEAAGSGSPAPVATPAAPAAHAAAPAAVAAPAAPAPAASVAPVEIHH